MTNRELRSYIRKEIVLNESQYGFSGQELSNVWNSFTAVFKTTWVAMKSLLSVIKLNYDILVTTDLVKLEKAFTEYESRSRTLTSQYDTILGPARERFNDLKPLLFLAAPGAYIASGIMKSPGKWTDIKDFFQDIGVDISYDLGKIRGKDDAAGGTTGGTSTQEDMMRSLLSKQKTIQASLDSIFGLAAQRTNESVILEEVDSDKQMDAIFDSMIQSISNNSLGIDKKALSSIIEIKKKQSDEYVRSINSPIAFLTKLSKAKTIEDVKSALNLLQETPFKLGGLEKITPASLEAAAAKVLKVAIEKKKLEVLFKEIGVELPEDEKKRIEAIKAYQLRNLLGEMMVKAKDSILSQIEDIRKLYLEKFEEDVPLDILKKIAPDSELERVVLSGLEKIKNAGKQQQ